MINNKKVFVGALGLILAAGINTAKAADDSAKAAVVENPAILFKIHDIKPVTNSDGQTTSCDFAVTFFNRSNENINGASIDLTWDDDTVKILLDEEKNNDRRASSSRNASSTVTANIEVPAVQAMKQAVVRTRLQSDRCFLLMDDVKLRVRSCNIASQSRSGSRSATVCANLFKFVSPNNQEYYREFKPVTLEEEAAIKLQEKENIKKDINEEYSKTVAEFERASQLLKEIK
ncbi:MAG: hypothetical protein LBR70_05365 [Lactobacillaceae bacterium]|jgi:hypothetical protein|nr:hypothetical protein [Lactobacillaceae bacterium]